MREPYITWKDFYSVGCKELDHQHRLLLGIVNDLYEAVISNADQQAVRAILDRLVDYTAIHFSREEELMEEHRFPSLEAHKILHNSLKTKTLQLRHNWTTAGRTEVLKYLKSWWLNHICQCDKEYTPFFMAQET